MSKQLPKRYLYRRFCPVNRQRFASMYSLGARFHAKLVLNKNITISEVNGEEK